MEREEVLEELIQLSEKKEIQYSKQQLEKMDTERLGRILERHRAQELDELNDAIVDTVIGKFNELMKGCKLVSKSSNMGRKLQEKKLFRQDMKSFVSWFTPLFPYVGLLEGAVCVANEIINNKDPKDGDESDKSEPEKGGEQSPPPEEPNNDERGSDAGDTKL